MPRIACLLVPDLPVAAACRADPDLAGRPLALSAGRGTHAPLVAAAAAARARGVRAGHTVAQARAIAADLVIRPRDDAAERSAVRALIDVAASLASRIEAAADGAVFLDAAGAAHLVPSEAGPPARARARAPPGRPPGPPPAGGRGAPARARGARAAPLRAARPGRAGRRARRARGDRRRAPGSRPGARGPEPRRARSPARRADARREDAPHLYPRRARGAAAARGGRAGGARRRPRGGARRAARALQSGWSIAGTARDHARTARRALRRGARGRARGDRLPPAGRGRRDAVHPRWRARAALRQRLPARPACAPAPAVPRGGRGPRPARLPARPGPGRARGRCGGSACGGG